MQCTTERDLPAMDTPGFCLGSLGVQGIKVYEGDLVLDPASKLLHEVPQHQPATCSTVCSVVRAVLV